MIIIPAIDIREGKCVRLVEGRIDRETIYSHDPAGVAQSWEELGAEMIHLVDLDGAFSGHLQNLDVVREIVQAVKIPVQIGGGIRNMKTIQNLLGMGVGRVILGTAAISQAQLVSEACEKFGKKIVVGIDSKNGLVAVEGWEATVPKTYVELGQEMKELGVVRVVFTDTRRDGTMKGPNVEAAGKLARETRLKVIIAGGVADLDDIRKIKGMEQEGLEAVIVGKALYAGTVELEDAIKVGRGEMI